MELKGALDSIASTVQGFKTRIDEVAQGQKDLQTQVDAMELQRQRPLTGGLNTKSLAEDVFESAELRHFAETGRGRIAIKIADFQRKTAITSTALGAYTSGVVMPERLPGVVPAALRTFRVRELMRRPPTSAGFIDFVRVTAYPQVSPQAEGSDKSEGAMTFASVSEKVKTLAHWIPVSKQAVQDLEALREAIDTHLMAGLLDEEDEQILSGDNTGENLNGLITQATAFDTSLLVASDGWEFADQIARAIQQLQTAKQTATGICLNPVQWWSIILTKNASGDYIFGAPTAMTETRLFGLPVSVSTAVTSGQFLVGDFVSGCALHVRMDGIIEVSDSHSDYFIKNLFAVRCEERVCLACYKPGAFIQGSFSQSPL